MTADRRPTFYECVTVLRKAAGDKRGYDELRGDGVMTFRFREPTRYWRACQALTRLRPLAWEQYSLYDARYEIALSLRACAHCRKVWAEHVPPGGQCLFASTRYKERTDD